MRTYLKAHATQDRTRTRKGISVLLASRMLPIVLSGLFLLSCSSRTGIKLKIVVDTELNSEQQVTDTVDTLEIVFENIDSTLTNVSEPFRLEDIDGNGENELIYKAKRNDGATFPLLRLKAGNVVRGATRIYLRGLIGSEIAAIGNAADLTLTTESETEAAVNLNLRPRYRAPRVTAMVPNNGQDQVPTRLAFIYLEFSRWMNVDTLPQALAIRPISGNATATVAGKWEFEQATVVENGLTEERTVARFIPDCAFDKTQYTLDVSANAEAASGEKLDQNAAADGENGFSGQFSTDSTGDIVCEDSFCKNDNDCGDNNFVCALSGPFIGKCIPKPEDCRGALGCPAGSNCVNTSNETYECINDCRVIDNCTGNSWCKSDTGMCEACEAVDPNCERFACAAFTQCETGRYCDGAFCRRCKEFECCSKPTDCPSTHYCAFNADDNPHTRCEPGPAPANGSGNGGTVCRTLSDCPPASTRCERNWPNNINVCKIVL